MKFLTVLIATVFIAAVIAPLPANACGCHAVASAWVGRNSAGAYASIFAYGVKRGGYYLTCTGKPSIGLTFTGTTSNSLRSRFDHRKKVKATASVGGSCPAGGGVQCYDEDSAGP